MCCYLLKRASLLFTEDGTCTEDSFMLLFTGDANLLSNENSIVFLSTEDSTVLLFTEDGNCMLLSTEDIY